MTSVARRLAASVLTIGLLAAPAAWSQASAEAPLDVTGPVTDEAGVLSEADRERVDDALEAFYDDTQRQLFVVYVDSFDGVAGADWAEATAFESGLGSADVLVAISTQQRAYGFWGPTEISAEDLERVEREHVLPALRRNAWADAGVAAAEGFGEVDQGVDVPWWLIVGGSAVVLAVAGYIVLRARRRYDHSHRVRDEHGNPVDPADILTDTELDQAAAAALVAVDDALLTSEQELSFAEAQMGAVAAGPFRTTLDEGRRRVGEASTLRQSLDDAEPRTDAEYRQMASRIITICEDVDSSLDTLVDDFDRLRDLDANARQALDAVAARLAEAHATITDVRDTWQQLQDRHVDAVVSPVAGNVTEADTLLALAHESVGHGRVDVSEAAGHIRVAESATAQAESLLAAVTRLATALAADHTAADASTAHAAARVGAVRAFIEAHRGAIGPQARTRLHEADRLLATTEAATTSDAATPQARLERAEQLLDEAQQGAAADVARWRAEETTTERRDADPAGLDALRLAGIIASRGRSSASRWAVAGFGGSGRRTRRSARSTRRRRPGEGKF